MARIPRSSRTVLSSGRTAGTGVSIPRSIADVGQGLEARGLGDIGAGLTKFAAEMKEREQQDELIRQEIKDREDKASDLNQSTRDSADRKRIQEEINLEASRTNLSNLNMEWYQNKIQEKSTFDSGNYINPSQAQKQSLINEAELGSYIRTKSLEVAETKVKQAVLATEDQYVDNPTDENRNEYEQALLLNHTRERTDELLDKADDDAVQNLVTSSLNQAQQILSQASTAESVGEAEAIIQRTEEGIGNLKVDPDTEKAIRAQVQASKTFASSRRKELDQTSKTNADKATADAMAKIVEPQEDGQSVDIASLLNDIAARDDIAGEDKAASLKSVTSYYNSYASAIAPPDISKDSALIDMEAASAKLAAGNISKTAYYEEYGKVSDGLSTAHRSKYIGEANPTYGKAIANVKKLADDEARRRIVTRTEEDVLNLIDRAKDGDIDQLLADTASMKHQTELLNYSGYQIDVFNELANDKWSDAIPNDALPVMRGLSNTWAAKEWDAVYQEFKDNKEIIRLTQPIIKAYNRAADNVLGKDNKLRGQNHWGDLSTKRQAAIIEAMDDGDTLEEAISSTVGRF